MLNQAVDTLDCATHRRENEVCELPDSTAVTDSQNSTPIHSLRQAARYRQGAKEWRLPAVARHHAPSCSLHGSAADWTTAFNDWNPE